MGNINLVQLAKDIDTFTREFSKEVKPVTNSITEQVERNPKGIKEWFASKTGQTFYDSISTKYIVDEAVQVEINTTHYQFIKLLHGISKQGKTTLGWLLNERKYDTDLWRTIVVELA